MKRLLVGTLVLAFFFSGYLGLSPPSNTVFAAESVRLNTQQNVKQLRADVIRLFPQGTPKSQAEEILLKSGAVIRPDERRPNVFEYEFPPVIGLDVRDARVVIVMYDAEGKVRQIWSTGNSVPLYPESPPANRSDATIFRFEDYDNADDLMETLRVLFPLETKKSDVEKVLAFWARASSLMDPNEPHDVVYAYKFKAFIPKEGRFVPEDRIWNVTVWYNLDDAVGQIFVDGSPVRTGFVLTREYFLRHQKHPPVKQENAR